MHIKTYGEHIRYTFFSLWPLAHYTSRHTKLHVVWWSPSLCSSDATTTNAPSQDVPMDGARPRRTRVHVVFLRPLQRDRHHCDLEFGNITSRYNRAVQLRYYIWSIKTFYLEKERIVGMWGLRDTHLLNTPMQIIANVLLDLTLRLLQKPKRFKALCDMHETLIDVVYLWVTIGTHARAGAGKHGMYTEQRGRLEPFSLGRGWLAEEEQDVVAPAECEATGVDADEPVDNVCALDVGSARSRRSDRSARGVGWTIEFTNSAEYSFAALFLRLTPQGNEIGIFVVEPGPVFNRSIGWFPKSTWAIPEWCKVWLFV